MKRLLPLIASLAAGCTAQAVRVGSEIPIGAQLSQGRYIESAICGDYPEAYAALVNAAHGDLITDVEVSDGEGCAVMRARAVKIVPSTMASAAPAAAAPLVAGGHARLRAGAALRPRPLPESEPLAGVDVGTDLTLKSQLTKDATTWWYATYAGGAGWVRQENLEAKP